MCAHVVVVGAGAADFAVMVFVQGFSGEVTGFLMNTLVALTSPAR